MLLGGRDVIDAAGRSGSKGDIPIDAGDHQADPPVPTGVTRHLADHVAVRRLHRGFGGGNRIWHLLRLLQCDAFRRSELNANRVGSGHQKFTDIHRVTPEHILRSKNEVTVEKKRRHGVQVLGMKKDGALLQKGGVHLEGAGINPVLASDPLHLKFIVGPVGIGNLSRSQQGAHIIARNRRRNGPFAVLGFQGPLAGEFDDFHEWAFDLGLHTSLKIFL